VPREPGLEREAASWFSRVYPRTRAPDWPGPRPLDIIQVRRAGSCLPDEHFCMRAFNVWQGHHSIIWALARCLTRCLFGLQAHMPRILICAHCVSTERNPTRLRRRGPATDARHALTPSL